MRWPWKGSPIIPHLKIPHCLIQRCCHRIHRKIAQAQILFERTSLKRRNVEHNLLPLPFHHYPAGLIMQVSIIPTQPIGQSPCQSGRIPIRYNIPIHARLPEQNIAYRTADQVGLSLALTEVLTCRSQKVEVPGIQMLSTVLCAFSSLYTHVLGLSMEEDLRLISRLLGLPFLAGENEGLVLAHG